MANWLDKYEQGGLVLKKKTKDNYGKKANPNDVQVSVGPDFVGLGYNIKGRDYSPAWGGRFQNGGFLQPNSSKLPEGYVIPYNTPSTELAMSIGGEKGEPAYLIPSFKGGKKLKDPIAEYKKTGEHLGGPFKTWQEAEKFGEMRHEYVEKGQSLPSPLKWWDDMQMGGSMPGSVGFTYARVAGSAPANGKYTKKTKASAQNGQEMKFYQEGLDFKPKSISQDGKTIPNEKEEIKPITTSQKNIGQAAAWKVIEAIKANTPYQLSESAVKSGIDPSLTCIGGVCNVYKDLGVDFSGVGNEKQGVRESRTKGKVVEYNPTFDKNYKAAGFEKVKGRPIEFNELTDIIQKGNLNPGDFIQYYNKKGIPDHTNIVLGSNPDGSVEVYNSYKHGQVTRGESKEPYVYTLNPEAQDYKGKKINVFRVGDQKATEIRDASANDPSGITNTWFNYNMEKAIQRRMKILEKDYQELAKQSGEPAKKLTPSQLRKAAIEEERRIYESDPMFKRNLEIINTVDFSESPQEAMYRTLNKKKNGGWLDNYSEPIRDDRGQWAHPGKITEIGSNNITMQGVDYPVLGISDTGDTQMMYPDQDYKFDGEKVTEYPMAQDGENITKKLKKEAEEKLERMKKPKATLSQYTPKKGEQAKFDKQKLQRIAEDNAPLNRMAASKGAKNMQDAIEAALIMEGGLAASKLVGKGAKAAAKYATEQTALKNVYKLNPYAFKPTEGMMYRGIGKEGMEDALQSGLFRAKQNVTPTSIGNFNTTRQFSKAYYTPRFDIADQYGQGYIAEVPRGASDWGKRYGKKEWSQIAQRDIPITEGKVLQKDWLKRYKEVPKPTASEQVVRGPIPAPYKGTTLPYDNIGYKEPATGELAPYMTPEFEAIPYSELPKTVYHGGPSVISDAGAIRITREGLPIQSATSPTSRGFYATPNTWMHMEGSPNPLRDVEGFYPKLASENAENYAMGRGDAYIHRGEFVENPRIVDWKTFSQMEPVKNLNPDFRRLSPEAAKIAEDLGIYGLRDNSEYNILNPQKVFKSFKPAYKNLGKGWEKYNKGGWLNKYK
jgi:hypothetical protein